MSFHGRAGARGWPSVAGRGVDRTFGRVVNAVSEAWLCAVVVECANATDALCCADGPGGDVADRASNANWCVGAPAGGRDGGKAARARDVRDAMVMVSSDAELDGGSVSGLTALMGGLSSSTCERTSTSTSTTISWSSSCSNQVKPGRSMVTGATCSCGSLMTRLAFVGLELLPFVGLQLQLNFSRTRLWSATAARWCSGTIAVNGCWRAD